MSEMTESALLDTLGTDEGQSTSLTQRAYRKLEELIVTLQLKPGEVISETALAQRLEIGRTPIREALQRLAREGLVVILPRRGILVSELDVRRQLKLLELRRELERLMARGASRRASEEERAAFQRIADGMREAAEEEDDITFMRYDSKLNLLLCRAARNEFVANAMSLTHGLSRRFWFQHHKAVGDLALCAHLHADLAAAVAAGEKDAAAEASDKLLDYVESFTRATLDSER
jgi:DNA-binding GntR family transcriptional regulator